MPRGSKPGKRRGGRKKGTPNKLTSSLKAAIIGALEAEGGQAWLEQLAQNDKRTFAALLGRVLPHEVSGKDAGPFQHEHKTIEIVIVDPKE